jgi:quinoprotein glucose dehydrogenase
MSHLRLRPLALAACAVVLGVWPARLHAVPGEAPAAAPAAPATASSPDREAAAFGVPEGFDVRLFASEPNVANPVAFSVDERGRVFVCETFRQNAGVTDNRGHDRTWLEADLAAETVADRIAYHRRLLGDKAADYERHEDRVRRLIDADGDGTADGAEVYSSGYRNLEDGSAAGILARRGSVYLTCIPSLYLLRDAEPARAGGDLATKQVLSTGYGVRVAFRGHDLHGLTLGPDGRIYFTIGDRGYRLEHDGVVDHDPGTGAVFRCDPDGRNLEVFAHGLRNPQELAFDDLGNLFTVDNNSDAGDKARLVHVVPGGEWGWNMAFQYLDDRGPWHREKIWHTECDGQPAWCLPPLAHLGAGPSGFCAAPGTGLPPHFDGRFLLADFRGAPAGSSVRSFRVRPKGGTFEPCDEEETFRSVLATDVEIGPDGAVWVSDWVESWDGVGKGRLWRFVPRDRDERMVAEVRGLLAGDWEALADERLVELLAHADRRIRLEAQWELVRREETATLAAIVGDTGRPLTARVHAAQGLGQRLRLDDADAAAALVAASADATRELREVACRSLGDCVGSRACRRGVRAALAVRLADDDLHVVTAAASSLGRLGHADDDDPAGFAALVDLAADGRATDRTVRHAVAFALAGLANPADLHLLLAHESEPVRLAACVALRRRRDAAIATLLDDPSERIVIEAARAIHDVPLAAALPALATRAATGPTDDAFLRRAVSAAEQVGTPEAAAALVRVVARDGASAEARQEAVDALATWAAPPRLNRVTGVWLPDAAPRDPVTARAALAPALAELVAVGGSSQADESLRGAVLAAASKLGIGDVARILRDRAADRALPGGARALALDALLESGDAEVDRLAGSLLADAEPAVRMASRRARAARNPTDAVVPELVAACGGPTIAERQQAVGLLAGISEPAATAAIETLAASLRDGSLDPAIALEVREAAGVRLGEAAAASLARRDDADPLADWHDVLAGGDPERGQHLFRTKAEVSCVRCHQAAGQGGEVGPKLDGIAGKRDARYLLEAIVHPNAKVADGYATTVIVTDEGLTLSGIVIVEDAETVTLRDAEGREKRVAVDSIDERASGPSAMPADLAGKLTRRELRDLLAWLQGLR